MHLDPDQMERMLHGEIRGEERARLEGHLSRCDVCRDRLSRATGDASEMDRLLGLVDHPVPRVSVDALIDRAKGSSGASWRWAAGLVLGLGVAGAAYAAPGSPFPGWVSSFTGDATRSVPSAPQQSEVQDGRSVGVAGIAVDPGARLVIDVGSLDASTMVAVSVSSGPEVEVRADGDPRFTSDLGRLSIAGSGTDTVQIGVPVSAPDVEIIGPAGTLLRWAHGEITREGTVLWLPADSTVGFRLVPESQ